MRAWGRRICVIDFIAVSIGHDRDHALAFLNKIKIAGVARSWQPAHALLWVRCCSLVAFLFFVCACFADYDDICTGCGGSLHHLTRYAGYNQALTCQRANGADCLFAIFGALVPRVVVCGSSVLSGLVD